MLVWSCHLLRYRPDFSRRSSAGSFRSTSSTGVLLVTAQRTSSRGQGLHVALCIVWSNRQDPAHDHVRSVYTCHSCTQLLFDLTYHDMMICLPLFVGTSSASLPPTSCRVNVEMSCNYLGLRPDLSMTVGEVLYSTSFRESFTVAHVAQRGRPLGTHVLDRRIGHFSCQLMPSLVAPSTPTKLYDTTISFQPLGLLSCCVCDAQNVDR